MTYDERLQSMDSKIEHLRKVSLMHRRIIDMLVKDMVLLKPKRVACDNSMVMETTKREESRVEPELRNPTGELI